MNVPDTSVLTPVPSAQVPRNWEKALGYEGNARWLSTFWTPLGDEAIFSDGLVSATASFRAYQHLTRQYKAQISRTLVSIGAILEKHARAAIYLLGSSDEVATYHLVLDLKDRKIYVATATTTDGFLVSQYPRPKSLPPAIQIVNHEEIRSWLEEALIPPRTGSFTLCQKCEDGWVLARDGGYDRCPNNCDSGIIWEVNHDPTRKPARQT